MTTVAPIEPTAEPLATPMPAMPVHVLTGFLGSGKTTLLNHLLSHPAFSDSAVIVNEFGDISIDHLLVEHSEDELIELAGGCVCCAVRGDLARTIAELIEKRSRGECRAFTRIIVETTGLADPAPIQNLLITDPLLAESTRHAGLVTVVDSINALATLDRFPEARKQVALADAVVLSKTDLGFDTSGSVPQRVKQLNPRAAISDASSDGIADTLLHEFSPDPSAIAADGYHHQHFDGIETFTLTRSGPIPGAALTVFVEILAEHLGAKLLRIKGLVDLEEWPGRPAVLQGAQHVFHPLDFLSQWPDPNDRRTRLVCIVEGRAAEWVECLLDALIKETQDMAQQLAAT